MDVSRPDLARLNAIAAAPRTDEPCPGEDGQVLRDRLSAGGRWSRTRVRPRYGPNQRAWRLEPNCCFSPTRATEGPMKLPVGAGPERKSTSTRPTRPPPNST